MTLCSLLALSISMVNVQAATAPQTIQTATPAPKFTPAPAGGKVIQTSGAISADITLNNWLGTVTVDLPVVVKDAKGKSVKVLKATQVPVVRLSSAPAMTIKVTKGAESVKEVLSYPVINVFTKVAADATGKPVCGYEVGGSVGWGAGNANEAKLMYTLAGLNSGRIQYYGDNKKQLFTLGFDYILVLDRASETNFLNCGKINTNDTFAWTGLAELLKANPLPAESTSANGNTGTSSGTVTKEQIIANLVKQAQSAK